MYLSFVAVFLVNLIILFMRHESAGLPWLVEMWLLMFTMQMLITLGLGHGFAGDEINQYDVIPHATLWMVMAIRMEFL